jgi:ABC-type multidrug transport system permease subunit
LHHLVCFHISNLVVDRFVVAFVFVFCIVVVVVIAVVELFPRFFFVSGRGSLVFYLCMLVFLLGLLDCLIDCLIDCWHLNHFLV